MTTTKNTQKTSNIEQIGLKISDLKFETDTYGNRSIGIKNNSNKFCFHIWKQCKNAFTVCVEAYGGKQMSNRVSVGYHTIELVQNIDSLKEAKQFIVDWYNTEKSQVIYFPNI
jgi:hypothetical protein